MFKKFSSQKVVYKMEWFFNVPCKKSLHFYFSKNWKDDDEENEEEEDDEENEKEEDDDENEEEEDDDENEEEDDDDEN